MEDLPKFPFQPQFPFVETMEPYNQEAVRPAQRNYGKPDRRGIVWSAAEDEMLLTLVTLEGPKKWTIITR
jgi:hypothetical protein